jgi:hypothetical protein
MEKNVVKLISQFADVGLIEGKECEFNVYALDFKDGSYRSCNGISHLSPFDKDRSDPNFKPYPYFIAKVKVRTHPMGGFMFYQHVFSIDLASLKIDLESINKSESQNLLHIDCIASIFANRYYEIADFLFDYSGIKDNYKEIANIIYKNRGTGYAGTCGI